MASIKYFIRTNTKNKLANIYVRLREGRTVDMTAKTGKFILPENWNNNSGTIRPKAEIENKDKFNEDLIYLSRYIGDELLNTRDKVNLEKDWLKTVIDKFNNPEKYKKKKITLFRFIESYIESSKNRINPSTGKKIASSTLKKYGTCFYHLKEYVKREKKQIDFDDITIDFYYDFTKYLTRDRNLATNTVGKQIAVLKGFMSAAVDQGLTNNTDFRKRNFKIVTEESEAIYLNEDELDKLWKHDFSDAEHLERVRDYFLIGCWTGCRFEDWDSINSKNITNGFLIYEQGKTGHKVRVPLHPVVKSILTKYEGKLPAKLQNQPFNRAVKTVCKKAKIKTKESKSITRGGVRTTKRYKKWKLVSSHTARRSFATNLYKSGFPSISIMAITGHRTERAFLKYIKVTPEEHAELLQQHWLKSTSMIKESV